MGARERLHILLCLMLQQDVADDFVVAIDNKFKCANLALYELRMD